MSFSFGCCCNPALWFDVLIRAKRASETSQALVFDARYLGGPSPIFWRSPAGTGSPVLAENVNIGLREAKTGDRSWIEGSLPFSFDVVSTVEGLLSSGTSRVWAYLGAFPTETRAAWCVFLSSPTNEWAILLVDEDGAVLHNQVFGSSYPFPYDIWTRDYTVGVPCWNASRFQTGQPGDAYTFYRTHYMNDGSTVTEPRRLRRAWRYSEGGPLGWSGIPGFSGWVLKFTNDSGSVIYLSWSEFYAPTFSLIGQIEIVSIAAGDTVSGSGVPVPFLGGVLSLRGCKWWPHCVAEQGVDAAKSGPTVTVVTNPPDGGGYVDQTVTDVYTHYLTARRLCWGTLNGAGEEATVVGDPIDATTQWVAVKETTRSYRLSGSDPGDPLAVEHAVEALDGNTGNDAGDIDAFRIAAFDATDDNRVCAYTVLRASGLGWSGSYAPTGTTTTEANLRVNDTTTPLQVVSTPTGTVPGWFSSTTKVRLLEQAGSNDAWTYASGDQDAAKADTYLPIGAVYAFPGATRPGDADAIVEVPWGHSGSFRGADWLFVAGGDVLGVVRLNSSALGLGFVSLSDRWAYFDTGGRTLRVRRDAGGAQEVSLSWDREDRDNSPSYPHRPTRTTSNATQTRVPDAQVDSGVLTATFT